MTSTRLPEVRAERVSKRLGGVVVLNEVSFELGAGSITAFVGANGSGKSTLLRMLSGQLKPDSGHVSLCGVELYSRSVDARQFLGYVPDHTEAFLDLTAAEVLGLYYGLRGVKPGVAEAQHEQNLELSKFFHQRMRTLSFGQRKRICLAGALGGQPAVWLLDEPTNGLDNNGCRYLCTVVKARSAQGLVTLATTHDVAVLADWGASVLQISGSTVTKAQDGDDNFRV